MIEMKKRHERVLFLAAALFMTAPAAVLAQAKEADQAGTPEKVAGLLSDERLKDAKGDLEAFFGEVEKEGLPSEPFASKVREGLTKKVEAKKIVKALHQMRERYRKAHAYMKGAGVAASVEGLGATADLVGAGIEEKSIKAILAELKGKDVEAQKKGAVLMSACLLQLMGGGMSAADALKKTLKAYRSKGIEGLKKEMEKSKDQTKSGQAWQLKQGGKPKGGQAGKVIGTPKGGKPHGK